MPGPGHWVRATCHRLVLVAAIGLATGFAVAAEPQGETLQDSICRLIETAASQQRVPSAFLTRLIWQESSFRPNIISRAGAQGIAQFMPGTARARGLDDPFDPEQAIPAAASLVADLVRRFGNLGLAAAAYNSGEGRVSAWLDGQGGLPGETRDYVARITGRTAEDWAADSRAEAPPAPEAAPQPTCLEVTAELKRRGGPSPSIVAEGEIAPWGVQLAGAFSKAAALASFERNRTGLTAILGERRPMILGGRLRSRGALTFYRVRIPAPTRAEADGLCGRIRAVRGACVVLRT